MKNLLVEIENLSVSYRTIMGEYQVLDKLNLSIGAGERISVVGESASGKSTLGHILAGMSPPNAKVEGSIKFDGDNILQFTEKRLTNFRGSKVFMIFQNPLNSLNPVKNIWHQLFETVRIRDAKNSIKSSEDDARKEVIAVLTDLRLPDPESILKRYPHELSGGQVQRIVIAMALILKPKLLIADEPTTALDVTIQAQFLDLLKKLNSDLGMSIIFITHDIALANSSSERLLVLYGGRVIELGQTENIIRRPMHPYTIGLVESIPAGTKNSSRLVSIPGSPPSYKHPLSGCKFHPRCAKILEKCDKIEPGMISVEDRQVRCWLYE